jgi:hypothetical protein
MHLQTHSHAGCRRGAGPRVQIFRQFIFRDQQRRRKGFVEPESWRLSVAQSLAVAQWQPEHYYELVFVDYFAWPACELVVEHGYCR